MSQGSSTSQAPSPQEMTIVQFQTEPTKELKGDVRGLISCNEAIINYCKERSQTFFNDYYENRTAESLTCLLRFFSAQARELKVILPINQVRGNKKESIETDRCLSFVLRLSAFINKGLEKGKYKYAIQVRLNRFLRITSAGTMNDIEPFRGKEYPLVGPNKCYFTAANQVHVEKLGVLLAMFRSFEKLFSTALESYSTSGGSTKIEIYNKVSKVLKDGFFEMCTKTDELDPKHKNYPFYGDRKVMNILSNCTESEFLSVINSSKGWSDLADKVLGWLHEDTVIRFNEPVHPVNMDVEACVKMAGAIYCSIMKTLYIVFQRESPIVDPNDHTSYFN